MHSLEPQPEIGRGGLLRRLRRSFVWKLSLAFFVVNFLLFFSFSYLFGVYWQTYTDTTMQLTNWGVAEEYVRELRPLLSPEVQREAVDQLLYQTSMRVPQQELFILDATGKVVFPSRDADEEPYWPVELEPINAFIRQREILDSPLYSINPGFSPTQPVIFSAAEIAVGAESGFVLVLLKSRQYGAAENMLGDLTAFSAAVLFSSIGFILSLCLAVAMFYLLSRRFAQMTAILREFRSANYSRRLAMKSNDELGEHAETINQMADQIVASMQSVKDIDASRRELIAGVAHDLRTPVAVMMIGLESLLEEIPQASADAVETRVRRVLRSCESLDSLVQELFELSKLGAENFKPNLGPVPVQDLLIGIQEQFSNAASVQDIELAVSEVPAELLVIADPSLIERAISNLVKNALSFTAAGGRILLDARLEGDQLVFAVRDNGVGIPESALPYLFDRFYRADNQGSPATSTQGSGLGLAIVKRIIEVHGSQISVTSTVGRGSEFSFPLPRVKP